MDTVGAGDCEQRDESGNITDDQVIKPAFAAVDDPERLIPQSSFAMCIFPLRIRKFSTA